MSEYSDGIDHDAIARILGSKPMSMAQLGTENLRLRRQLAALRELAETLRDVNLWLQRHLDMGVKPRGYSDPSGHPHGYSVVEIPDWDVKQKIEDIGLTLSTPAPAGEADQ